MLLSTFLPACFKADEGPQVKNFLFIIMDTAVADHLAPWGYERQTTPYLDALAEEGFTLIRAYSQAPSTLPSTWSIHTGLYPIPKPAEESTSLRIRPGDFTLADAFKQKGFATFGFSENPYINAMTGFDQGFDKFTYYRATIPDNGHTSELRDHSATDSLFRHAREAIGSVKEKDQPWYCYIHLLRPHEPFLAPKPLGTQFMSENVAASEKIEKRILNGMRRKGKAPKKAELQYLIDSYDGNLAYADFKIGEFLDWLREEGAFEDTVIVIASDHGEAFLEHGRFGHGYVLFEELLHVPLIFHAPEPAGILAGVSTETAEMVDVYPTLAEIFGLETPYPLHGRSLLSGMRGGSFTPKLATFAQTLDTNMLSVRIGNLKMICTADQDTRELSNFTIYDLEKDPGERNNLYTLDYPLDEFIMAAEEYMARWPVDSTAPEVNLEEQLREELEAIGYLGN